MILDRVFKKLLDSEKEAAQPAMSARTQLNRDNYSFELLGYEIPNGGVCMCCRSSLRYEASTYITAKFGWTEPIRRHPH